VLRHLLPIDILLSSPFWEGTSLLVGLVVGSFANVCIHRLPGGASVVAPPSRCPSCSARIRPWDNIPVLSYVLLLGRCRSCRAWISPRYPLIEIANGLLFWALASAFGPSWRVLVLMAFVTALLILVWIDLDHHLLPDVITVPGILVGLAASFLPGSPVTPLGAAAAAAGGYLAFFVVANAYRLLRGVEGLGQGDWKLAAMLGAFLGWEPLLLTIFLAALGGTLVGLVLMLRGRTLRHALPLGTFLGLSAIVVLFTGEPLLRWYRGLLRV
jgi:leader peptidase (prepilin peptidase)/N-methyltransferase